MKDWALALNVKGLFPPSPPPIPPSGSKPPPIEWSTKVLADNTTAIAALNQTVKALGASLYELRLFFGPGYRVYFTKRGRELVILLAGGDKSTQATDIKTALRLAHNF